MLDQRPQDIQLATVDEGVQKTSESNQETVKKTQGIRDDCKAYLGFLAVLSFAVNIYLFVNRVFEAPSAPYFCPDNWIVFQDKCYYFSEEERNWNSSRDSCLSQNADLVLINTPEEMRFLKRFKCTSDHWINVERSQRDQGTKGIVSDPWHNTTENDICSYLNEDSIATARCYTERNWICEKKIR